MSSPVVQFEILAPRGQGDALRTFYRETFGWCFAPGPGLQCGLVEKPRQEEGIPGTVDASSGDGPGVVIYVASDDIRGTLEKATASGGEVVMDVTTIPGLMRFAQFRDPAGNIIGILDSSMGQD